MENIKIKPVKITYTTTDGKIHTEKINEAFVLSEKTKGRKVVDGLCLEYLVANSRDIGDEEVM